MKTEADRCGINSLCVLTSDINTVVFVKIEADRYGTI